MASILAAKRVSGIRHGGEKGQEVVQLEHGHGVA
jgi:hypothetical protein